MTLEAERLEAEVVEMVGYVVGKPPTRHSQ
jgi:hypothetical protein